MYDYLIVGAGLFGAVFAHEAKKHGKSCLVVEKRNHIAGNIYCKNVDGIHVHQYGAHIFHPSDRKIWDDINQFSEFNNYINSPVAIYKDELYNLPFNMNTFSKMWNIQTPAQAKAKIAEQIADLGITEPKNLEEQALSLVGTDVYEKLIKGYTEKQWGRSCRELPSFIIRRLPLRFTYDNNYFISENRSTVKDSHKNDNSHRIRNSQKKKGQKITQQPFFSDPLFHPDLLQGIIEIDFQSYDNQKNSPDDL